MYKDYENRLCNAIGYLSEDIEIEELLELRKCALLKLPVDFFKNLKYRSSRDIIYERQVTIRKMHPGFNYEEIDKCGNINNIDYYLLLLAKINKEFRLDIKTSYDSIVHNEREVTPIIRFIEEASKSWNIR